MFSFARRLLNIVQDLQHQSTDSVPLALSLRQVLRIAQRLDAVDRNLAELVHDTLMTQFLPETAASIVQSVLGDACDGSFSSTDPGSDKGNDAHLLLNERRQHAMIDYRIECVNGKLGIDGVFAEIQRPSQPELVPKPLYFDIPGHTRILKHMLQDLASGQKHLLLIGNQGVGKNKLADRLLELLKQEREYVQLHRDVGDLIDPTENPTHPRRQRCKH